MTDWISVIEKTPELYKTNIGFESNDLLIYTEKYGIIKAKRTNIGWWEESLGYNEGADELFPTHWMPLPKDPVKKHFCKNGNFKIESSTCGMWMYFEDDDYVSCGMKIISCPFCGEKA